MTDNHVTAKDANNAKKELQILKFNFAIFVLLAVQWEF